MNVLFKINILILLLISLNTLKAQRIGIIGGENIASLVKSDNLIIRSFKGEIGKEKMRFGYSLGIIINIPLREKLSLESSILYSTKGNKSELSTNNGKNSYLTGYDLFSETQLNYIDIPVNLKISHPLGVVRIFVAIGPYFAIGTKGTVNRDITFRYYNGRVDQSEDKYDLQLGNSSSDHIKRFDYGVGYRLGVEYNSFQLGASYSQGLLNIFPNQNVSGASIKNRVFQVSVAYFLLNRESKK